MGIRRVDSIGRLIDDLVERQKHEEATDGNLFSLFGKLPLLTRAAHIVYFLRDVRGDYPITPKVLPSNSPDYNLNRSSPGRA